MRFFFCVLLCGLMSCQSVHSQPKSRPTQLATPTSKPGVLLPSSVQVIRCLNRCVRNTQILAAHLIRSTYEGKVMQAHLDKLYRERGRLLVHDLMDAAKLVHVQLLVVYGYKNQQLPVPSKDKSLLILYLVRLSKTCQTICAIPSARVNNS